MDLNTNDEILIEKIAEGDEFAFRLIIERYQFMVLNFAYRLIGNAHNAEDIAREGEISAYLVGELVYPGYRYQ